MTLAYAIGGLLALWPPPLPGVEDEVQEPPAAAQGAEAGAPESSQAPEAAPDPAPDPAAVPAPPPPSDPADTPPARDRHGDPIMEYGEGSTPGEDLPYAEEPAQPEPLEYAPDALLEDPQPEYDTSVERPPPPREASEREGQRARDEAVDAAPLESPQRFAIELKFGPYLPSIDRNSDAELGPYAQIFGVTDPDTGQATGQPKPGLFTSIGFEWQFIDLAGPMSIGTTVGFFRDRAAGLLVMPDEDGSYRSRADKVSFGVVPVTLLFGYRFEYLADRFRVPLVPYARAGLGYAFWWSTGGDGKISTNSAGVKGRGGSLGWQANLGMMLRLDFIDNASSRALDRATGINHTYLFGEYMISRLDGFGSDKRFAVGDDTWLVGLAIAF